MGVSPNVHFWCSLQYPLRWDEATSCASLYLKIIFFTLHGKIPKKLWSNPISTNKVLYKSSMTVWFSWCGKPSMSKRVKSFCMTTRGISLCHNLSGGVSLAQSRGPGERGIPCLGWHSWLPLTFGPEDTPYPQTWTRNPLIPGTGGRYPPYLDQGYPQTWNRRYLLPP